ncbi:MAG: hypothetical protein V4850_17855 [Myxococcota bacterium]
MTPRVLADACVHVVLRDADGRVLVQTDGTTHVLGEGAVGEPAVWTFAGGVRVAWRRADGLVYKASHAPDLGWIRAGAIADGAVGDPSGCAGDGGDQETLVFSRRGGGAQVLGNFAGSDFWRDVARVPTEPGDGLAVWAWPGLRHVAWVQSSGAIRHIACPGGAPTSPEPSARAVGRLAVYAWPHPEERTDHIVFRGPDGHVHELWLRPDGEWNCHALTSAEDERGEGSPTAYVGHASENEHVLYRGSDGVVHHRWARANTGNWRHERLHALPPALSDVDGCVSRDGTHLLTYWGAEGVVIATQTPGDGWRWHVSFGGGSARW